MTAHPRRSLLSVCVLCATLLTACAVSTAPPPASPPPVAATPTVQKAAWPHGAMVSAANPYAVEAAAEILAAGGHAVDAAIAAHAVLGLVEPQSSGLGGGAFMLVYDRERDRITVYDGRETAPAGAAADMFMRDGEVMDFRTAWQSGVSVGVPGTIALYKTAHDAHGTRPWPEMFASAIDLADEGFVVSPRLNNLLERVARFSLLDEHPDTAAYFYPGGKPLEVGFVRKNPDYAATLRDVAARGPQAMYGGAFAEAIASAAQAEPNGGTLSASDIAAYRVAVREPLCGGFRDYTICTAPPPSSGLAQIAMAGLYERLWSSGQYGADDRVQAFVDAQRLAYADRDHYVADPDFAAVPSRDLITPAYLDQRATERFAPDETATPGDPGMVLHGRSSVAQWGRDTTLPIAATSHLSIIDVNGNAVSMTASVEAPFGSSRWVGGFLLNNQMTDFARDPSPDGKLSANAAAPGKRARSSMSPTLTFDGNGELLMATGSPGGNSIIAYVAKSTIGVLAWDMPLQEAIDFPNVVARGDRVRVETAEQEGERIAQRLKELGYDVQERRGENSGLHAIVVHPDRLEGAADPRREGEVRALAPADVSRD